MHYLNLVTSCVSPIYVCSVSKEDKALPSPFTQAPTASLIVERDRQAKEKASVPGSSKLRRLRGHEPAAAKVQGFSCLSISIGEGGNAIVMCVHVCVTKSFRRGLATPFVTELPSMAHLKG